MRAKWFNRRAVLLLLLGLLLPVSVAATPVTYSFTSGSLDVTGTVGATTLFSAAGIPMSGVFVEFDDAVPEVVDFTFTGGPSGLIPLSSAYGGFDGFVLDSFSVAPGTGFSNISVTGGPTSFSFTVGPVDATGVATPFFGVVPGAPIPFSETSGALTGSIDLGAGTLTLDGITFLVITGIPGEPIPLVVKGDLTFTGMVVVPEPTVAMLLALGLGFGLRRR